MKFTKIVCTIGPASDKPSTLKAMVKAGMNVCRLNFSHGTHSGHKKLINLIRSVSKQTGEPLAILADLQGPKIRLGELPDEGVQLKKGASVKFSTAVSEYKKDGPLPLTYKNLHKDVKKGHRFLIDDGLLELVIESVKGKVITAKVINGGKVTSHKGMNFPDSTLSVSPITEKDKKDVEFAVRHGVDWVALSFVTSAKNVYELARLIRKAAKRGQILPRIIVKIEKHEAIQSFDEILAAVEGVMVARGDLGIEIPAEDVPVKQKEIVEKCRLAGKPVIVATQMMDSMIRNPRPTRAEVSDVANAVCDHTDAVMLSGESATGKYPKQAVEIMGKIVVEAEASPFDDVLKIDSGIKLLALQDEIDAVLVNSDEAPWAETIMSSHPEVPMFLASSDATVVRQNNLRWGVKPFLLKSGKEETFIKRATTLLKKKRLLKKGMRLAVVQGGKHGDGYDVVEV